MRSEAEAALRKQKAKGTRQRKDQASEHAEDAYLPFPFWSEWAGKLAETNAEAGAPELDNLGGFVAILAVRLA